MRMGRPTMSSLKLLNQDAEHAKRFVALAMNINAAKGLQEVLKTNLGPKVLCALALCRQSGAQHSWRVFCHDGLGIHAPVPAGRSLPLILSLVSASAGYVEDVGGRRG